MVDPVELAEAAAAGGPTPNVGSRRWFVVWMLLSAGLIAFAHPLSDTAAGLLFVPTLAWIGYEFGRKVLGVSLLSALVLLLALPIAGVALPVWIVGFLLVWYLHTLIETNPVWLAYVFLMLLLLAILVPAIAIARTKATALQMLRGLGPRLVSRALADIGPGAQLAPGGLLELTDVTTDVGSASFLLQSVVQVSPGHGPLELLTPVTRPGMVLTIDEEGRPGFSLETADRRYQVAASDRLDDGELHLLQVVVDREAAMLRLYVDDQTPATAPGPGAVPVNARVEQAETLRLIEARIATVR